MQITFEIPDEYADLVRAYVMDAVGRYVTINETAKVVAANQSDIDAAVATALPVEVTPEVADTPPADSDPVVDAPPVVP